MIRECCSNWNTVSESLSRHTHAAGQLLPVELFKDCMSAAQDDQVEDLKILSEYIMRVLWEYYESIMLQYASISAEQEYSPLHT